MSYRSVGLSRPRSLPVGRRALNHWNGSRSRRIAGAALATVIASSSLSLVALLVPAATPAGAVTPESHTAVQVTGQTAWTATQISEGGKGDTDNVHGCALTTASPSGIKCWGYNSQGELGLGNGNTTNPYDYPVNVSALSTAAGTSPVVVTADPQALAVGDSSQTCVIVNTASITGGVQCWGANGEGELGNNTTTTEYSPTEVVCGTVSATCTTVSSTSYLSGVTAISAGGDGNSDGSVCAVATGGVFCWGNDGNGQTGAGNTTQYHVPTQAIAINSASAPCRPATRTPVPCTPLAPTPARRSAGVATSGATSATAAPASPTPRSSWTRPAAPGSPALSPFPTATRRPAWSSPAGRWSATAAAARARSATATPATSPTQPR